MNSVLNAPKISAANITIRRPVIKTNLIDRLRTLLAACGANRNDQAIALITACLGDGIDQQRQILELAGRLGLNTRHVAIILKSGKGTNWRLEADGAYTLLT